jgi:hypothetical protein
MAAKRCAHVQWDRLLSARPAVLAASMACPPRARALELAPLHWSATSSRDDIKASLAENPYRALTLLG